jgi:hypothetical protein
MFGRAHQVVEGGQQRGECVTCLYRAKTAQQVRRIRLLAQVEHHQVGAGLLGGGTGIPQCDDNVAQQQQMQPMSEPLLVSIWVSNTQHQARHQLRGCGVMQYSFT